MHAARHAPRHGRRSAGMNAMQNENLLSAASARLDAMLRRCTRHRIDQLLFNDGARPATHCYALVSTGQCDEGVIASMVAAYGLSFERLFMQTPEAEMADIGPWLIEIPLSGSEALRRSLARHAASQALTLMCSPMRLPRLCEHLRGFLSGTLADGSPVLLRYFDPRVGFDMLAHWPASVQGQFMQPLDWWAGWDGDAQLRHANGDADIETAPRRDAIELAPEWARAMDKVGEAHLLVALLAEELEASNPTDALLLEQVHPLLCRQIAQAALAFIHRAGFAGWSNKAQACHQALLRHARFHAHPGFLEILPVANESLELREVLARVPRAVQQEWAQDRDAMLVRLCDAQADVLLASLDQPASFSACRSATL